MLKLKFICLLLLVCSFGCDTSEYTSDSGYEYVASDIDIKLAGRARLRNSLNDPGSLDIIDEILVKPGRNGARVGYEATFMAKNAFGGYITDTFYTE